MTKGILNVSLLVIFVISMVGCNKNVVTKTSEKEEVTQVIENELPALKEEEIVEPMTAIYGRWKMDMEKTYPGQDEKAAVYLFLYEDSKSADYIVGGETTNFDIAVDDKTITLLKDGAVISISTVVEVNENQLIVTQDDNESNKKIKFFFNSLD